MARTSLRVATNVAAVIVFGVVMVIVAFLTFVSGVAFDDSYQITATIPDGSGALPRQEVTVMGRAVGTVQSAELVDDGVLITMKIQPQFPVPSEASVRIMRRSPIGEQAVEITPPPGGGWEPIEPGSSVIVTDAPPPTTVETLLTNTVALFEQVSPADTAIVIRELAAAFDGRANLIRDLNTVTIDLGRTLLEGQDEFRRLLATSEPLLAELDAHADDLVRLFDNVADLNEVFAANRGNLEELLRVGPDLFHETETFIVNIRADVQCLVDDLTAVNEMLLGPSTADGAPQRFYDSKLDEVQMGIDKHRFFFQLGIPLTIQPDPDTGMNWARVNFLLDHAGSGERYPELRPTPPTLPGAACETAEWGTGVNAVRQANHQPHDPGSPGIFFAPLVDERGPDGSAAPPSTDRPPLPTTGGGLAILAIAGTCGSLLIRRRR